MFSRLAHAPRKNSAPPIVMPVALSTDPKSDARIDALLVQRYKGGDETAFLEIMRRYQGRVYSLVHKLVGDAEDAERITQESFVHAHRELVRFPGESTLGAWLYRIALDQTRSSHWVCFRSSRRRKPSPPAADPAHDSAPPAEFTDVLSACIDQLDPRHRDILMMRNVLSLSYREIGRKLHVDLAMVKSRIAAARECLHGLLAASATPGFGRAGLESM
jgi:RNA polymerase sigma-70 factor (ECF subfamily)